MTTHVTKAEDTRWHEDPDGMSPIDSEKNWTRVPSQNMKYERSGPLTYGPPNTEQYRENWERIFDPRNKHPDPHCPLGWRECGCAWGDDTCFWSDYADPRDTPTDCTCPTPSTPSPD